jgi:type I restriction enzyme S subunit
LSEEGYKNSSAKLMPPGAVLFSSRAPIGYCVIASNEISTNQGFKSFVLKGSLSPEYLRHYLVASVDYARSKASGTTFQELSGSRAAELAVPIAPSSEQRRIVAKIDNLSTKSKRARDHLDHIPRLVEKYKQAILAAAFRGEITRQGGSSNAIDEALILRQRLLLAQELRVREWKGLVEHSSGLPTLPRDWKWMKIGDLAVHRNGLAFKSETFSDTGLQVVRLGNLYNGVFDLTRSPIYLEKSMAPDGAFIAKSSDILVSLTGTKYKRDYGHFVRVPEETGPLYVNQRVVCLSCVPCVNPDWIVYFSQTPMFRDFFFSHETGGVNQGNVGLSGVMDAPIPVPSLSEQKEIIRRVTSAFTWVDRIAGEMKSAANLMKQLDHAVLAKAFRGELVPQDPADEPASKLLERVRSERSSSLGRRAKRSRKSAAYTRAATQ